MARVYTNPNGLTANPADYKEQQMQLYEALTLPGRICYIAGVGFVPINSSEWRFYEMNERKRLKGENKSPAEIKEALNKLAAERPVKDGKTAVPTTFRGLRYHTSPDGPLETSLGGPLKNFISDSESNIIFSLLPEEKQVIVLPYKRADGQQITDFFAGYEKIAEAGGDMLYCDYRLRDALDELCKSGFRISKGQWINSEEWGETRLPYEIVKQGISYHEAFAEEFKETK